MAGGISAYCLQEITEEITAMRNIQQPNNSPEPTPITLSGSHSRLTVLAARLSFFR
jgi:hypothetical protein